MIIPNIAMPTIKAPIEHSVIIGSRNSARGIKGSGAFDSEYRNPANIAAANASSSSTRVEDQPKSVTQVSASSSGTTQQINVTTPAQSICRFMFLGCQYGKLKYKAIIATIPTGRLT